MNTTYKVYALIDPRDNQVKYIGCTKLRLKLRLWLHIHNKDKSEPTEKKKWIDSLTELGLTPLIQELQSVAEGQEVEAEQAWIEHYKGQGVQLTNMTKGGPGLTGLKHRNSTREKMSEAGMGRPMSEAAKTALSKVNKGSRRTLRQRLNTALKTKEALAQPEIRAKMSERRKAYLESHPETREQLSRTSKEFWSNPANKSKMSERRRGENNGRAKLKESDVLTIKELLKSGVSCAEIAGRYNVASGSIYDIKHNRNWRHVHERPTA